MKKKILLGECKWRENLDEAAAQKSLAERIGLIKGYEDYWLYLFTKNPVAAGTINKNRNDVWRFVCADDLFDL